MINKRFIIFIFILFISYIISFINFISNLNKDNPTYVQSKTIVVITGNVGRLKAAENLMNLNSEARLLISGVAKGVKFSEIIKSKSIDRKKVDLGYNAKSTLGNAIETKVWVGNNNLKDFILITDDWHMKRALLLFKNSMPNINIYPYELKSNFNSLKEHLLFEEHLKYLIAHLQVIYIWFTN